MKRSRLPVATMLLLGIAVITAGISDGSPASAADRPMPTAVEDVQVHPAGANQVRITWRGGARTTRYAFIAGSTSLTDQHHFQTRWISARDRSVRSHSYVLTVPARLRPVLGAGSGDYVFVKIVQTNATGSVPECRGWTPSTLCRASASGSYSLAGSLRPAAPTVPLRVASWNVQSVSATQSYATGLQWSSRRIKIGRAVRSAAPDVIGTQESTTARLAPSCVNRSGAATADPCREQYMDLADAIGPAYALSGPEAWSWVYSQYERHRGDSSYSGYVDSAIYYRSATVDQVQHGFLSPFDDLHLAGFRDHDEAGAWAVLQDRSSGERFLFVSLHFPVGDSNARLRHEEAVALAAWCDHRSKALGGVPVLLTGDLNSYAGQDADPAVAPLRAAGFVDAAAAAARTNARWSSTNESNSTTENSGYPTIARIHPYPTSRIDYILTLVPSADPGTTYSDRYENVVHLRANGTRFDAAYEGSDHNMQLADLRLPAGP